MATHSSTLAWKIPWAEKPGRLQAMGSRRVGWEQLTDGLFIFSERLKSFTLVVLNNVAEFVCKYKLL